MPPPPINGSWLEATAPRGFIKLSPGKVIQHSLYGKNVATCTPIAFYMTLLNGMKRLGAVPSSCAYF